MVIRIDTIFPDLHKWRKYYLLFFLKKEGVDMYSTNDIRENLTFKTFSESKFPKETIEFPYTGLSVQSLFWPMPFTTHKTGSFATWRYSAEMESFLYEYYLTGSL